MDRRPRAAATASTATSAAGRPTPTSPLPRDARRSKRRRRRPSEAGLPRVARDDDAAALPGRGGRALRQPGRVPPAQVPARARRTAGGSGLHASSSDSHAVEVGSERGSPAWSRRPAAACSPSASSSPRTTRSSTARSRSRGCTPQRSYAIACRIARRAAAGHVHQRRQPHALDPRRADRGRRRTRSCCSSAARATRPAPSATPSCATSGSRRSRASTGTCASVEYRWSAQDPIDRSTCCPTSARSRRATTAC